MSADRSVMQQTIARALSGRDSHVVNRDAVAALAWRLAGARPAGVPHSVFQLVNHMIYWQEWVVRWLEGKRPRPPEHAGGSWPGQVAPTSRREWERTVRRFRSTLAALDRSALKVDPLRRRGKWTPFEMLHVIGSHTSYHVGQVALLRRMLESWPPPSGGVTW